MKRVSKYLSIFLILCNISASVQIIKAKADEPEYKSIIDNETFTNYADGTLVSDIPGWSFSHPSDWKEPCVAPYIENGVITIEQDYDTNKTDHDQSVIRSFDAQSGRIIIETVVNVGEITSREGGAIIVKGSAGFAARIQYSSSNKYYVYNDKTINYIPADKSNDIKIKLDLQTNNHIYDLYIAEADDEYLKLNTSPIPFMVNTDDISQVFLNGATMGGKARLKSLDIKKIIINTPPAAEVNDITMTNGTLECSYNFIDAEGGDDCSQCQWYKKAPDATDFVPIEGAVDKIYLPSISDDGAEFMFVVTPIDEKGLSGETAESSVYKYTYVEPVVYSEPVAKIQTTTAFGMTLTGNYEFVCDERIEEENKDISEYQWYVSDELFGEYLPIAGATDREFTADKSTLGKFLKFTVTPVDCMGTRGKTAEAFPVLQNEGIYLDFEDENDIATGWEQSNSGGDNSTFGILNDPTDESNKALALIRNKNTDGTTPKDISMADYRFSLSGNPVIVNVDIYVDMKNGTSETLYLLVSGNKPIQKLVSSGNKMSVGYGDGAGNQLTWGSFENNQKQWHNYRLVFDSARPNMDDDDTTSHMFDLYFDNKLIAKDLTWRTNSDSPIAFRSFLQSGNFGSVYLDNFSIVTTADYSGDVVKDKNQLYIPGNTDEVMYDLELQTAGDSGSVISWQSSDPDIISNTGMVTRPAVDEADCDVELTAYIMKSTICEVKKFNVTVLRLLNPEEAVNREASVLSKYSNSLIDRDISLPVTGDNSTSITWKSDKPEILSNDGKVVTRPDVDTKVIMTATITREGASVDIDIPMYVLKSVEDDLISQGMVKTSSQKVGYEAELIGDDDFRTVWHSSDKDTQPVVEFDLGTQREFTKMLISEDGNSISGVNVEISSDRETWEAAGKFSTVGDTFAWLDLSVKTGRYVRLSFSKSGSNIKVRDVRMYNTPSATGVLEKDVENFKLPVSDKVTSDFVLETVLESGTTVTYSSSEPSVISIQGNNAYVNRPSGNGKTVIITAYFTYGSETCQKAFRITVPGMGKDKNHGGGGGGGGSSMGVAWNPVESVDATNNASSDVKPDTTVTKKPKFTDLSVVPWAEKDILNLADKGILNGISEDHFGPMLHIKREEFTAVLVRMLGISDVELLNIPEFEDVVSDAWYADAIAAAYNAKITEGLSDRIFGIGYELTREDMAVMIARVLGIDTSVYTIDDIWFEDRQDISDYAVSSVAALIGKGILKGNEAGRFMPKAPATRAECAVVIAGIYANSDS